MCPHRAVYCGMAGVHACCALHCLAELEILIFRKSSLESFHRHQRVVLIDIQYPVDDLIHSVGPEIQHRAHFYGRVPVVRPKILLLPHLPEVLVSIDCAMFETG